MVVLNQSLLEGHKYQIPTVRVCIYCKANTNIFLVPFLLRERRKSR